MIATRPRRAHPKEHGKKNASREVFALPITVDTLPIWTRLPVNKLLSLALVALLVVVRKCDLAWLSGADEQFAACCFGGDAGTIFAKRFG